MGNNGVQEDLTGVTKFRSNLSFGISRLRHVEIPAYLSNEHITDFTVVVNLIEITRFASSS
jgi:hypothetical protein